MDFHFLKRIFPLLGTAVLACCLSCVTVDYDLGADFLATDQQFDTFVAEFPLEDIRMMPADSLSGYSQTRITFGAIRDGDFGLTTRSSAVTLVPMDDSLDFGTNARFRYFRMNMVRDTVSVMREEDQYTHQNINVYELSEPLDSTFDINSILKHGSKRITSGVPVFNGTDDTLGFFFTKEFGQKYLGITPADTKSMESYTKRCPGIVFETDEPVGEGGRINIFDLQLKFNASYYYIQGNYAELGFTAEYGGVTRDTSFLFYFSPDRFYDVDSLIYNASSDLPQYCLNVCGHETHGRSGTATDKIYVEGGGGLKPVLSATEIREKLIEEISRHGNPKEAAINRASLYLPFEFPEDYKEMIRYPQILSPTCRIRNDSGRLSFAGLTDSSDSSEDQGDVNRSLLAYMPDITYHTQSILKLDKLDKIHNYDVWFLIMANETQVTTTSAKEQDEMSQYYNMMMYSSYYNGMYGGYGGYGGYGYGGYGYGYGGYGYGGYGDYYSNYYSYMLMAQMMGGGNSTSTSVKQLDKDRYYRAVLNGPKAEGRKPMMTVTYSLPKSGEN